MSVVHVGDSEDDERSWHVIHANSGPILVCVWYRPPCAGETSSIQRFEKEYAKFLVQGVSFLAFGIFNVHNKDWLRHSSHNSPEGTELEILCCSHGLTQHVQRPTRGAHLLDLVLSDFRSGVTSKVTAGIHEDDHNGVLTTVNIDIPSSEPVLRQVYNFKKAKWDQLRGDLLAMDWRATLAQSADAAAADMTQIILDTVGKHISRLWITDKVYAHPWLNDACRSALAKKHAAVGASDYARWRDKCSAAFLRAREDYVSRTREELKTMSPSSRGWWKLSTTLMTKAGTRENIPPLQRPDGTWALSSEDKASELARVFKSKSHLPPLEENEYSALPDADLDGRMRQGFLRLRVRTVYKFLLNLEENSGTGPDLLPSRILKQCARALALPVTLLSRKLLREHRWPLRWRCHWVHGIHKRESKALGRNYRGVHLTPQLSKVVERSVGSLFIPCLEASQAFGPHQYAYSKGKGYKDVLTINVCNWILLMEQGFLVGVYCSDVSGAFDRVSRDRLCVKLRALGLHSDIEGFLESWLEERSSKVVSGGKASADEPPADSVYQGTVLGPPLWNVFFADSRLPLRKHGYTETVFADD